MPTVPGRIDTTLLKCLHQFKRCLFLVDEAEIHRMANSADVEERINAVEQLRDNFASFSNKTTAWSTLIQLTQDENSRVRWNAANMLGSVFYDVPDKDIAWSDLIRLTQDEDSDVR